MVRRSRYGRWIAALVGAGLCVAVIVAVRGCGGHLWRSPTSEEQAAEKERKKKEEEEKKKKEFDLGPALALPHNPVSSDPERRREQNYCFFKPGHWTATAFFAKANKADFQGELEQQAMSGRGKPLHLEAVPFDLVSTRDVAMPKGQGKVFESLVFVPPTARPGWVEFRVRAPRGGRTIGTLPPLLMPMPSYQYHFVVLSDLPERYSYLPKTHAIAPPSGEMATDATDKRSQYYLVDMVPVRPGRRPAVPSHALYWTSTAYMLWDDADPTALSSDQQAALLDWLHWGGQLILSGPTTLEALGSSFLKDYLPVSVPTGGPASRALGPEDLAEINERFTPVVGGRPWRPLRPGRPWDATRVELRPQARYVPGTGELLAERRVGRGRIVASVFRLSGKELVGWSGFDAFLNACVLRRPPRHYGRVPESGIELRWADEKLARLDAGVLCGLRYFSRDSGMTMSGQWTPSGDRVVGSYAADVVHAQHDPDRYGMYGMERAPPGTGVAAWNDFSATAAAARESLSKSSRIEIPERSFVVWAVLLYLAVLVPANWALFRALGRVEWAWLAAPVIAICCTFAVVRLAQLDIGFARSVTEIGVLEIQGNYPRGHMTRYLALYTSLATGYELEMESGGQLQPFPRVRNPGDFRLQPGEEYEPLEYRHGSEISVSGWRVGSNSTQYLHSEQMVDLEGALTVEPIDDGAAYRLVNRTGWTLRGAGVVRRRPDGRPESAWLGTLEPGTAVPIRFDWQPEAIAAANLWSVERDEVPLTARATPSGELTLRDLIELAQETSDLQPGQMRLIGYLDEEVPGLVIDPAAPQAQRATLVIAHLHYDFGPDPEPDVNAATNQRATRYD